MHSLWLAVVLLALAVSAATAQDRRGMRFWNLTLYTVTSLQMSPAGRDTWGPDQCQNDRDGTVDHDERLRITGIEPGRYDVKLADRIGRRMVFIGTDGGLFQCLDRDPKHRRELLVPNDDTFRRIDQAKGMRHVVDSRVEILPRNGGFLQIVGDLLELVV